MYVAVVAMYNLHHYNNKVACYNSKEETTFCDSFSKRFLLFVCPAEKYFPFFDNNNNKMPRRKKHSKAKSSLEKVGQEETLDKLEGATPTEEERPSKKEISSEKKEEKSKENFQTNGAEDQFEVLPCEKGNILEWFNAWSKLEGKKEKSIQLLQIKYQTLILNAHSFVKRSKEALEYEYDNFIFKMVKYSLDMWKFSKWLRSTSVNRSKKKKDRCVCRNVWQVIFFFVIVFQVRSIFFFLRSFLEKKKMFPIVAN
ncbi:hypothetical protein RFI_19723 [Reticulomyxa filosa]|uniref:Uncharacterized protein n=1 Tax=Reticulomyxa filosa TaxID=46433 RepID=X6MVV9_RETFI|nr:hypothetical protein RFI_19723 [Reticulomyxa filosa]|eukprot:ETO17597.1 hypothetical protein RFI_19723 [Reticulomyxa filosa]